MRWTAAIWLLALAPTGALANDAEGSPSPPATAEVPVAEPAAVEEWWAGHQVVFGTRKVPILGSLDTRTDSFLLARVVREGDELLLEQRSCRFEIAKVAGVRVSFREGATFPPATIRFQRTGDRFVAQPWSTTWSDEDIDGDGRPGATVEVDAPICGGSLFVGASSRSLARGEERDGALRGEVRVEVAQQILGTSGSCLEMMARDSTERVSGSFAYKRVPPGTTCESLLQAAWPVQADEPRRRAAPAPERRRIHLR
ncbi:hypothetical protein [Vulgatibacter sp.]|uniref:hypothetical protein n=1 Tax=Vulgatibacter sp. TaxID=1971226 RepID=UPI003567EA4B